MDIKSKKEQVMVFKDYTNKYIDDSKNEKGYILKQKHSLAVLDEALRIDNEFTKYGASFKRLLELESLFHDIGRFEQLRVTGTLEDEKIGQYFNGMSDHGDLGAFVMRDLLGELIPDTRRYDYDILETIRNHSKINKDLVSQIDEGYLSAFKCYDLKDLFQSYRTSKERNILKVTNLAIVQDADRLDILRRLANGSIKTMTTLDPIDLELVELFKQGALPSIREIVHQGKWTANVGHLVRMDFINQTNLLSVLKKIRDEHLIEKLYEKTGNAVLEPIYQIALEKLDDNIAMNEGSALIKTRAI